LRAGRPLESTTTTSAAITVEITVEIAAIAIV
jgi:hypothetical protein